MAAPKTKRRGFMTMNQQLLVAEKILKITKSKGWDLAYLSRESGVSSAYLTNALVYPEKTNKTLGESALVNIIKALGLSISEEADLYKIAKRVPSNLQRVLTQQEIMALIVRDRGLNNKKEIVEELGETPKKKTTRKKKKTVGKRDSKKVPPIPTV